jgi:hypothetical protein
VGKNKDAGVVIHTGEKSWLNGKLKTDCGLTLPAGTFEREHWFDSAPRCPACAAAKAR